MNIDTIGGGFKTYYESLSDNDRALLRASATINARAADKDFDQTYRRWAELHKTDRKSEEYLELSKQINAKIDEASRAIYSAAVMQALNDEALDLPHEAAPAEIAPEPQPVDLHGPSHAAMEQANGPWGASAEERQEPTLGDFQAATADDGDEDLDAAVREDAEWRRQMQQRYQQQGRLSLTDAIMRNIVAAKEFSAAALRWRAAQVKNAAQSARLGVTMLKDEAVERLNGARRSATAAAFGAGLHASASFDRFDTLRQNVVGAKASLGDACFRWSFFGMQAVQRTVALAKQSVQKLGKFFSKGAKIFQEGIQVGYDKSRPFVKGAAAVAALGAVYTLGYVTHMHMDPSLTSDASLVQHAQAVIEHGKSFLDPGNAVGFTSTIKVATQQLASHSSMLWDTMHTTVAQTFDKMGGWFDTQVASLSSPHQGTELAGFSLPGPDGYMADQAPVLAGGETTQTLVANAPTPDITAAASQTSQVAGVAKEAAHQATQHAHQAAHHAQHVHHAAKAAEHAKTTALNVDEYLKHVGPSHDPQLPGNHLTEINVEPRPEVASVAPVDTPPVVDTSIQANVGTETPAPSCKMVYNEVLGADHADCTQGLNNAAHATGEAISNGAKSVGNGISDAYHYTADGVSEWWDKGHANGTITSPNIPGLEGVGTEPTTVAAVTDPAVVDVSHHASTSIPTEVLTQGVPTGHEYHLSEQTKQALTNYYRDMGFTEPGYAQIASDNFAQSCADQAQHGTTMITSQPGHMDGRANKIIVDMAKDVVTIYDPKGHLEYMEKGGKVMLNTMATGPEVDPTLTRKI
jgi:hypothetical protein